MLQPACGAMQLWKGFSFSVLTKAVAATRTSAPAAAMVHGCFGCWRLTHPGKHLLSAVTIDTQAALLVITASSSMPTLCPSDQQSDVRGSTARQCLLPGGLLARVLIMRQEYGILRRPSSAVC